MQVFEEKHGYKALQEKGKARAAEVGIKLKKVSFWIFFSLTEKKEGEAGERGGVGEEKSLGLARPKILLNRAAAEIFGLPIQLVFEKIIKLVKL